MEVAYDLAAERSEVHVVHVLEPGHGPAPGTVRERMERLAEAARNRGLHVHVHVVEAADPSAAIARQAAALGTEVVVLGAGRPLIGPVASALVRKMDLPLLLLRDDDRQG